MTPPNQQPDLDTTIDRTLRALGAVEPSANFKSRLQNRLNPHQLSTQTLADGAAPRLMVSRFAVPRLALGLALAGTAVSAFLVHTHRPMPLSEKPLHAAMQSPGATARGEQRAAPARVHFDDSPSASLSFRESSHPSVQARPAATIVASSSSSAAVPFQLTLIASAPLSSFGVDSQAALDARALENLHAPSQPAPADSSTSQERLVRLMLRQGEKHDLAQLEPAERAAFAQQQTREFNTFFNPPAPKLEISLANRVYAPHAVTLDEVERIDAAQRLGATSFSSTQPTSAGDLK